MTDLQEVFGDLIHAYTRADAIADGVLCDVSKMAKEAGIGFPVALTSAVWDSYVEFPADTIPGQDTKGRLWNILWMLRVAIRASKGGDRILYQLHVALPDRGNWEPNETVPERGTGLSRKTHRLVTLKALCHPGDYAEPVITIMLPNED